MKKMEPPVTGDEDTEKRPSFSLINHLSSARRGIFDSLSYSVSSVSSFLRRDSDASSSVFQNLGDEEEDEDSDVDDDPIGTSPGNKRRESAADQESPQMIALDTITEALPGH